MALFGGERDVSFFRNINKELINDIVQSEVDVYQQEDSHTDSNLYGESELKVWKRPVRLACLIKPEDQEVEHSEFGGDRKQGIRFAFLRDELKERNLLPQNGNIIHWNEKFWEIDNIIENKIHMSRNPETNKEIGSGWGWDVSIICIAYMSRINRTQLEQTRFGGEI